MYFTWADWLDAFCGMIYLALFTVWYMRISYLSAPYFALVPVGVAGFVAATRIHENKHDLADVSAGAVIGNFND